MDKNLKTIVSELKKASRMHAQQAKKIEAHIKTLQRDKKKK
tara:strand:+ start:473 stop:595 length:123 start_codon:yes stop_codon:yes gene_type:complete